MWMWIWRGCGCGSGGVPSWRVRGSREGLLCEHRAKVAHKVHTGAIGGPELGVQGTVSSCAFQNGAHLGRVA